MLSLKSNWIHSDFGIFVIHCETQRWHGPLRVVENEDLFYIILYENIISFI